MATVQDYLDAVNRFILEARLTRLWPGAGLECEGCHLCCHEPAPVTLQDAYRLMKGLHTDLTGLFSYLWVEERDRAVDITLRRRKGDACVFLGDDGRCTVYEYRPFVCQTYICCPIDPVNEELRSSIVNKGEDALVREAILWFRSRGQRIPVNRGKVNNIRLSDWPVNRMSRADCYRQIMIRDVVPRKLYRSLLDDQPQT